MRARVGHILILVGGVIVAMVLVAAIWSTRLPDLSDTGGPLREAVPVLVMDASEFDTGLIPNDKPSMKELKFRNDGQAPLRVSVAQVSCTSCLGASKIRKGNEVVRPGGEGVVEVWADPRGIGGWVDKKTITIESDDPMHKMTRIEVIIRVEPEFTIEPDRMDFGDVAKGDTPVLSMRLRQVGQKPLKVKEIKPGKNAESVEFSFSQVPKTEWAQPERAEYIVTGRLLPSVPVGRFYAPFTVVTNCKRPGARNLSRSVQANVTTFYEVKPAMMNARAGASPGGKNVVSATVSASVPIEILDLAISGNGLSVSSRPGPEDNTVVIELSVLPTAKPGLVREKITFNVKGPELTVPHTVRAYVSVRNKG